MEHSKHKQNLQSSVDKLFQLTSQIDHKNLNSTLVDLRDRIHDPFMFVIVGEVKAGKSSFINALLRTKEDICKVAPSPMTDTIQQIVYGEEHSEEWVNEYIKRISFPEEKLREIAIVDTPGTNTIIDHHQEITERFIPASDLIIFVFESKNPYRQSAWEFFDFIKEEWHKKVIFILQQKDLMEADDLRTNIAGVREYAEKKGMTDIQVFDVSAKMEQEGKHQESGYIPVRAYIDKNITGGQAPILKLININETSYNINEKIYDGLLIRRMQYEADVKFRNEIASTLTNQQEKTERQINILVENLVATYNKITGKKQEEIRKGISFFTMIKRSFSSMFGFEKSPKEYLENLITDLELQLNTSLKDKLNDGVVDIAESIQYMGKLVDIKIKDSQTILKDNHEIFSNIAEKRANVLIDLQKAFSDFLKRAENFYHEEMLKEDSSLAPSLVAGGSIAVVGALTTVLQGAVFDITGGVLTAIGLTFAGVTVGIKRKKILQNFDEEIDKGRIRLEQDAPEKLKSYTSRIRQRIEDNFFEFDKHLNEEKEAIESLERAYEEIKMELKNGRLDLDQYLSQIQHKAS